MIRGIGLDVVEIERVSRIWLRFGLRFAEKILTPAELARMPKAAPAPYLAARFAAKEAAAKALGTGLARGVWFDTIEVASDGNGRPRLEFLGPALEALARIGATGSFISLTHSRTMAAAVVVLEG